MNSSLSFVSGVGGDPLLFQTVGQTLDLAATKFGSREALISCHQETRYTYEELNEKSNRIALGLHKLGLRKGDRIGIWSPNCVEWVLTQFATAKLGLILVNINPAYRSGELEYALNQVGCKALVTAKSFKSSNYFEMLHSLAPELASCAPNALTSQKIPSLKLVISIPKEQTDGMFNFSELENTGSSLKLEELQAIEQTLDPDDSINIQFTSGTTGLPKGATLSHFNIVNNAYFVGKAMKFSHTDRLCIPVPLYHCFGMVMGVLTCATHGSTMVFPSEGFEPYATLKAVSDERCTALHGVPTMFVASLEDPNFESVDLSSLRTGIMAGAPCPVEVMKKVQQKMHMPEVTIAYGMTETSPVSFQSATDDPIEKRVSTVGRVMPHVQVKIIDEEGQVVPKGVQGELCTRGYSVMSGYWAAQEKTDEALKDGWMHTGDLAVIDDEGYGNIVGRVKDMIIRGGENIYPREIEEYLYKFEKIEEAAVFGIPDEKYGEVVAAWVKVKEPTKEEEILAFCSEQIAHFKVPSHIKFVEEFPMTVSGKIQKFLMREAMIKELGLKEAETA